MSSTSVIAQKEGLQVSVPVFTPPKGTPAQISTSKYFSFCLKKKKDPFYPYRCNDITIIINKINKNSLFQLKSNPCSNFSVTFQKILKST